MGKPRFITLSVCEGMKLLLVAYNLLFPIVFMALLPGALLRMWRRGNFRRNFWQRFGIYSAEVRNKLRAEQGKWIWIHAVSVGEVFIALKLIRTLREQERLPVLLSTTTTTGFAVAEERCRGQGVVVMYHPVDFWFVVCRAMDLVRPALVVLVEAEVWPNLVWQARKRGVPVALVNARLSERSEGRFRRVVALARQLFSQLDAIGLQGEEDRGRFEGLGACPERLVVTGSIKFDMASPAVPEQSVMDSCLGVLRAMKWADEGRPLLLGASTHAGEEALLGRVYQRLWVRFPRLRMVVVPRHAERASEACGELEGLGMKVARRTQPETWGDDSGVLVVDTTGELWAWTQLASVVFVGKSLLAKGGQNPVEAVMAGKPVVFGPNMQNFEPLAGRLVSEGGAAQVSDERGLQLAIEEILSNKEKARKMVEKARAVVAAHAGATGRTWKMLRGLVPQQGEGN